MLEGQGGGIEDCDWKNRKQMNSQNFGLEEVGDAAMTSDLV